MSYETIILEKEEGVATITFNRPERLNAFNSQMIDEFMDVLKDCGSDEGVRVVVITGAGQAFCSGADVEWFSELIEQRRGGIEVAEIMPSMFEDLPLILGGMVKPTIAAINGDAVGLGFTTALACDIRIASDSARMGAIFVRMGVIPECGSTYLLPRVVGIAKALELVLTARMVDANEAKEIGLVNQVVVADDLKSATMRMAGRIAGWPPVAVQIAKRGLYQGLATDLHTQVQFESFGLGICYRTEDHAEAVKAFLEKRPATFHGR